MIRSLCFTAALLVTTAASAQDDAAAKIIGKLDFRGGDIALPAAGATLHLASSFKYLGPDDAERVLTELWGNPPGSDALGMLVPSDIPLSADDSWAVVITYSDDGYVKDDEAASIDYDDLLAQMQEETRDSNAARERAGYGSIELVGWAEPPHYDQASNKLYWAKRLKFDGAEADTLNYDIRVLGRKGYLSLNAVAGMGQLAQVQDGMRQAITMAEFDTGQRYADFNESTDKLAGYGLAALIGGAVAAKAGLFAKLGALLLAGKKFVILGLAGLAALAKKLFGRKDPASG